MCDELPSIKPAVCKVTSAEAGVIWQVMIWALAQAGNRAGKTRHQVDPGQVHDFQQSMICVLAKSHVFFQQPSFRVCWFYEARPGVFFDAYRWDALDVCYFFKYYGAWIRP